MGHGHLIDIVMGNVFKNMFVWYGGLGPNSRPF